MSGEDDLIAEGVVTTVLSAKAFRVRLANGHDLVGHAALRQKTLVDGLQPGDGVTLVLSPYDLSAGRIIKVTKNVT